MKISDSTVNLFGKTTLIESKDLKLNKDMLDIANMQDNGDSLFIPLKLKLDDIAKDGNGFGFATYTNQLDESSSYVNWDADCDYDKSFVTLSVDSFALLDGMDQGEFPNCPMSACITIIPFSRTQNGINAEINDAKRSEPEPINKFDVVNSGAEPYYYWQEVQERILDEEEWLKTHSDKEGHYHFYDVSASPEELEEIRQMLLTIPEIKQAVDDLKDCIVPVGEGIAV